MSHIRMHASVKDIYVTLSTKEQSNPLISIYSSWFPWPTLVCAPHLANTWHLSSALALKGLAQLPHLLGVKEVHFMHTVFHPSFAKFILWEAWVFSWCLLRLMFWREKSSPLLIISLVIEHRHFTACRVAASKYHLKIRFQQVQPLLLCPLSV